MHTDEVPNQLADRCVAVCARQDSQGYDLEATKGLPELHGLEAVATEIQSQNVAQDGHRHPPITGRSTIAPPADPYCD